MAFLTPSPKTRFFTEAGAPLVGGKVYTYAAGTSTPLATYTSQAGTTPNTNPVILDANGEADIWLTGASSYKFTLTDSDDVVQWTVDNIVTAGTMSLQSAAAVNITGGTIDGVTITGGTIDGLDTPLQVGDGGTGATTTSGARTALGLGAAATLAVPIPVASGGTGSANAADARTALGLGTLAVVNSPTPVANGGTGATTLTANNVILGNGTSAVSFVAPGSSGNVLTSNGTTWQSTALGSQVTSAVAGVTAGAVGSYAFAYYDGFATISFGGTASGANLFPAGSGGYDSLSPMSGTWRCMGYVEPGVSNPSLWLRIS